VGWGQLEKLVPQPHSVRPLLASHGSMSPPAQVARGGEAALQFVEAPYPAQWVEIRIGLEHRGVVESDADRKLDMAQGGLSITRAHVRCREIELPDIATVVQRALR